MNCENDSNSNKINVDMVLNERKLIIKMLLERHIPRRN